MFFYSSCWSHLAPHSEGSNLTPAHHYPDFRFKTYAPVAFRYFRELFGIRPDDYLVRYLFSLMTGDALNIF